MGYNYEHKNRRRNHIDLNGLTQEEIDHYWREFSRDPEGAERYRLNCLKPSQPITNTPDFQQKFKSDPSDFQIIDADWVNRQQLIGHSSTPELTSNFNLDIIQSEQLDKPFPNNKQDLGIPDLAKKEDKSREPWFDPAFLSSTELPPPDPHLNTVLPKQGSKIVSEIRKKWNNDLNQDALIDTTVYLGQEQKNPTNPTNSIEQKGIVNVKFGRQPKSIFKLPPDVSLPLDKQKELAKHKDWLNPAVLNAWSQLEKKKLLNISGGIERPDSGKIGGVKESEKKSSTIGRSDGFPNIAFHRQVEEIETDLTRIGERHPEIRPFLRPIQEKVRRLDSLGARQEDKNNSLSGIGQARESETPRKLPEWMPVKEAAKVFNISTRSIWRNISEGEIATKEEIIPVEVAGQKVQEVTRKLVDMRDLADFRVNRMGKKEIDPSDPIFQLLQEKKQ